MVRLINSMLIPLRALAYILALTSSATVTACLATLGLSVLPKDGSGLVILVLAITLTAGGVALLESKLRWRCWLEEKSLLPPGRSIRSSLLRGQAPLPVSFGVVLGVLIAVRLS